MRVDLVSERKPLPKQKTTSCYCKVETTNPVVSVPIRV